MIFYRLKGKSHVFTGNFGQRNTLDIIQFSSTYSYIIDLHRFWNTGCGKDFPESNIVMFSV